MCPKLYCALVTSILLQFSKATSVFDYDSHNFSVGITVDVTLTRSTRLNSVTYFEEFVLPPLSQNEINVDLTIMEEDDDIFNNFGFTIVQVHSHLFNVTLGYRNTTQDQLQYYNGTNLGIMLDVSKRIYLWNLNYFTAVEVAVANVIYDHKAPIPGGCSLEVESHVGQVQKVTQVEKMLQVDIHAASEQKQLCRDANLTYEWRYLLLDKDNLSSRTYFSGIKALVEASTNSGLVARKQAPESPNRKFYMAVPGTAIVFNTIVRNSYGIAAAYVPAVTYSCIPYQWNNDCCILSNCENWTMLAVVLIVIGTIRTFLISEAPVVNLFVRSLPVCAYFLYISIIAKTKSLETGFAILIIISVSILITYIGETFKITHTLSSVLTQIIYGWILAVFVLFPFVHLPTFTNNTVYWMVFVTILIIPHLVMTFSSSWKFLSTFMNVSLEIFTAVVGILILTKSSMLLILLNNIYRIEIYKYRFVNGYPIPTGADFIIFLGMIAGIAIGVVFHRYKLFSFEDHIEVPNERGPFITRWANDSEGSDDVFETPRRNNRYFKRLAEKRKFTV